MTPDQLRTARKRLGLSQHGMAEALRMGKSGWQSVSRWEKDGNTVPGPAQVAIELMLEKQEWVEPERLTLGKQPPAANARGK